MSTIGSAAPALVGRIERRILLDWFVDPQVAAAHLPAGLQPRLYEDAAVVGVCLIRLTELRPAGWRRWVGRPVEAAAHRISPAARHLVVGLPGAPRCGVDRGHCAGRSRRHECLPCRGGQRAVAGPTRSHGERRPGGRTVGGPIGAGHDRTVQLARRSVVVPRWECGAGGGPADGGSTDPVVLLLRDASAASG